MPHASVAQRTITDHAQSVALQALAMIVEDDQRLNAFLDCTGADGSTLAAQTQDLVFLGAVMDFILQDDERIIDLEERTGCPRDSLPGLRNALPGGHIDGDTF